MTQKSIRFPDEEMDLLEGAKLYAEKMRKDGVNYSVACVLRQFMRKGMEHYLDGQELPKAEKIDEEKSLPDSGFSMHLYVRAKYKWVVTVAQRCAKLKKDKGINKTASVSSELLEAAAAQFVISKPNKIQINPQMSLKDLKEYEPDGAE